MHLVIMRGLPGSGKSTKVHSLTSVSESFVVCSADDYFIDRETGEYNFNPAGLAAAHAACKADALSAMASGVELVVVDNTNIQHWEYEPYIEFAKTYNYTVQIIVVGGRSESDRAIYAARNTHGVPESSIRRMAERWED
jgi:predicted kinase